MGCSPYLGRDGVLHRFTYIKVNTARIYEVIQPHKTTEVLQMAPAGVDIKRRVRRAALPIPAHAQHDWQQRRHDVRRAA